MVLFFGTSNHKFTLGLFLALELLELLSLWMYYYFLISKWYVSNIISKLTLGCLQGSLPFPFHPHQTPLLQRLRLNSLGSFLSTQEGRRRIWSDDGRSFVCVCLYSLRQTRWFIRWWWYKLCTYASGVFTSLACLGWITYWEKKKIGGKHCFLVDFLLSVTHDCSQSLGTCN